MEDGNPCGWVGRPPPGLVTDPNVYVLLNPHRAVMDPPLDWQKLGSVMEQMVRPGGSFAAGQVACEADELCVRWVPSS